MSEADTPTDFEKTTYYIGKNIFVENSVFKNVTYIYICLYRKEDGMIKNCFNIPVELGKTLKKAINLVNEKIFNFRLIF